MQPISSVGPATPITLQWSPRKHLLGKEWLPSSQHKPVALRRNQLVSVSNSDNLSCALLPYLKKEMGPSHHPWDLRERHLALILEPLTWKQTKPQTVIPWAQGEDTHPSHPVAEQPGHTPRALDLAQRSIHSATSRAISKGSGNAEWSGDQHVPSTCCGLWVAQVMVLP